MEAYTNEMKKTYNWNLIKEEKRIIKTKKTYERNKESRIKKLKKTHLNNSDGIKWMEIIIEEKIKEKSKHEIK